MSSRKLLLSLAASAAIASFGSAAYATTLSTAPFNFTDPSDPSNTITGIDHIGVQDPATIIQSCSTATCTTPGAFVETGSLNFIDPFFTSGGIVSSSRTLTATYTLSGTDVGGNLVFNTAANSTAHPNQVQLFSNGTLIATFQVAVGGSTGLFNVVGGASSVSTIQLQLEQIGPGADVFTLDNGSNTPLSTIALNDLPSIQVINSTTNPSLDNPSLPQDCATAAAANGLAGADFGGNTECVVISAGSEAGDLFNSPIPEPSTIALLGISLFGLGYAVRRRRSLDA